MLFSFEQFIALNHRLGGLWRIIWLNILFTTTTLLGLVVLGFGPASYALASYLDGWFRRGETPPVTRTFLRTVREQGIRPMLMGWVLLGAGAVILVNLLSITDWYLRAANLLALGMLLMIGCYVFFVMAALEVRGIRAQITTALLLGVGSLHWTIVGATAVALSWTLMLRFAVALFPLLGMALPAVIVAAILRGVLTDLDTDHRSAPMTGPTPPTPEGHPA